MPLRTWAASGLHGLSAALAQPAMDVVLVELLRPQHPGERLAHDPGAVLAQPGRDDLAVERVRLRPPGREHVGEVAVLAGRQPRAEDRRATGGHLQHAVCRALGARLRGVRRRAVQHVVVERDLRVRPVALVLAEQPLHRPRSNRNASATTASPSSVSAGFSDPSRHVLRNHSVGSTCSVAASGPRLWTVISMSRSSARPSRTRRRRRSSDPRRTRRSRAGRAPVRRVRGHGYEPLVRERRLRVLVGPLHVRVRGRGVQVEPVLLRILAVVALAVGEPEDALLEDRIRAVPQRERKAQTLLVVRHAREPVLAPPVGLRARFVVGERVPRVTAGRVVLAHRAPLSLGQVRAPRLPRDGAGSGLFESFMLWGHACAPCQTRAQCADFSFLSPCSCSACRRWPKPRRSRSTSCAGRP